MRRLLSCVFAAWLLCGCGPEESASATFNIVCTLSDTAGAPLSGRVMRLRAYKMDYSDSAESDSLFNLSEDTRTEGTAALADFTVGYTLHKRGEDSERASFTCTYGAGDPGTSYASESTSVGYEEVAGSGGVVSRRLNLVAN